MTSISEGRNVLVVGATGTTGSAVLARLAETGTPVRAMTRSREKADDLRRQGIDVVIAPADDANAVHAAFEGVSAAYIATPSSPEMPGVEHGLARVAVDHGVHVVKLSVVGATADSPLRFARLHAESEAAIEALAGSWTFVQPNGFMQNDLAWAAQVPSGVIAGTVMDAAWSIVDVADIAGVAAAALIDPENHQGGRIVVTGPEARTPRDRVAALAKILDRELGVVDVAIPEFVDQLRGYGVPTWQAEGLQELFEVYAAGWAASVAPDAQRILGRPTRTWEQFAAEHSSIFGA